jgi:cytochrome b pre-mRNA-processing protein 3
MALPEIVARWIGLDDDRRDAERIYATIAAQARDPAPFRDHGVPDTLDGRFDVLCVLMFLVLRRIGRDGAVQARLGQDLYAAMFADMDRSLRELGVGDLGVARRVQHMAEGLMGRIKAYGDGLDAADPAVLEAALRRNLFASAGIAGAPGLTQVATYLRRADSRLAAQPIVALRRDGPDFPNWEGPAA